MVIPADAGLAAGWAFLLTFFRNWGCRSSANCVCSPSLRSNCRPLSNWTDCRRCSWITWSGVDRIRFRTALANPACFPRRRRRWWLRCAPGLFKIYRSLISQLARNHWELRDRLNFFWIYHFLAIEETVFAQFAFPWPTDTLSTKIPIPPLNDPL